jgi:hypothetical protein
MNKGGKMKRVVLSIILTIFFLGVSLYAQEAPFNISKVIEKVSHHPIKEDERIVIKDRVYEVFFEEHSVILKPKAKKRNTEDLVIPINGKPEIKDGKVVYKTKDREIIFEGTFHGLRFNESHRTPLSSSLIYEYSGNVANLETQKITNCSLTGEFLLDTNFVYSPEPGDQQYPAVAFDGTNYLVVWQDNRGADDDIYGTRVSQSGQILDPSGITISTATDRQEVPAVAFDGTNYCIVWQDRRSGYNNYDIYGARVSQDGMVLDPTGIAISTAIDDQEYPAVTFGSTNYFVVWGDSRGGDADIYGARINQSGIVLDPAGIVISSETNTQEFPSVDFDGTNFWVVWEDQRSPSLYSDIYGSRVSQYGVVLDSTGIAISTATYSQKSPSIAFDGTNYFVVWEDRRSSPDIYGARVSPSGNVLDTAGIAISTAINNQESPSVAFDGLNYLVVWQDYRGVDADIYGTRVNPTGEVLDTAGIAISTAINRQEFASVAFDGLSYLVVWTDERNGYHDYDIYGTRVLPNGTVIDSTGIVISTVADAYEQNSPGAAFDGTNYLVIWCDARNGNKDIYGTRVNQFGLILDPLSIAVSTNPENQYSPSVAFDGTNYFVVWTDERDYSTSYTDIYGTRINQSGTVLDSAGIAISTFDYDQQSPIIAFDNTNYLVVWEDRRNGNSNSDIYGTRVTQSGTVLEPTGFVISNVNDDQEVPAIAFGGTNYLVVWEDERNAYRDIYGARISPAGTVLEPAGIAISNASSYQESTSVAFDGTNFLVVWQDRRGPTRDIYAARVNQSGLLLDTAGIPICNILENQNRPDVAFDGANYFILWQDYRNGTSWDIYGAKLNPAGTVIDTFTISTQNGNQLGPAVTHGPNNRLLIVYSGWTDSIGNLPANSMRIWGKLYPGPGIEEERSTLNASRFMPEIYPNPFKSQTTIRYITNATRLKLKIYNISGKLVKSFFTNHQHLTPDHYFVWNGTDDSGKKLPAGVYLARFETNHSTETKEVIILR